MQAKSHCALGPSVNYSVPCDWILQRARPITMCNLDCCYPFLSVLHLNRTALSQSESMDFFKHIIILDNRGGCHRGSGLRMNSRLRRAIQPITHFTGAKLEQVFQVCLHWLFVNITVELRRLSLKWQAR